jgi:signal transduction histidine kinase
MSRLVCLLLLLVLNSKISLLLSAQVSSDEVGLPGSLLPITNGACLLGLSRIQANQEKPVRLEGVVTRVDKARGVLVVQNEHDAVAIHSDLKLLDVRPGQVIYFWAEKAAGWTRAFPEFPLNPSARVWLTNLSSPVNWGGYYVARMHGYLIPPVAGDYRFWIAGKTSAELWLSTNASANALRKIASVPAGKPTKPLQWDKYPAQGSEVIHLQAGQPCLLDVMQEHRAGGENTVAVAWQIPGMGPEVIDGRHLIPYASPQTNGIFCEYWNDYLLASVPPLTAGEMEACEIVASDPHIQILGESSVPDPLLVEVGEFLTPAQNFRWCEMVGVVSFATKGNDGWSLELTQDDERAELKLPGSVKLDLAALVGKTVRARGVCEAVFAGDGMRKLGGLWVPAESELTDIGADCESLQSINPVSVGELTPENPLLATGRRIRIRGKILQQRKGQWVVQGTSRFGAFISTNGETWMPIASPVDVPMDDAALAGLVVSAYNSGKLSFARFDSVSGMSDQAQDAEISSALPMGKTTIRTGGQFEVAGGGTGFGSGFERVHFYSGPLADKSEIVARLVDLKSPEAGSVAGLMIRASAEARDRFVSLTMDAGGGINFRFRQLPGERDEMVNPSPSPLPCWLKLRRTYPTVLVQAGTNLTAEVGETVDLVGSIRWENETPVITDVTSLDQLRRIEPLKRPGQSQEVAVPTPIAKVVPDRNERLREGTGAIIVRGVVTFVGPPLGVDHLVIQDETAGALVRLNTRFGRHSPRVGERVEFEIKSRNEKWPLPLDPYRMQILGPAQMPEPLSLAAANTQIRRGEYRWVECQGIVLETKTNQVLLLETRNGEIPVWVGPGSGDHLEQLIDTLVNIRAVLIYRDDRASLFLPSAEYLEVVEPAAADPFSVPAIAIDKLGGFARPPIISHRVKVAGIVTSVSDKLLIVQDDSGGVRVKKREAVDVEVSDRVEVVGFPEMKRGSVALTQALVRKTGQASLPEPRVIASEELYSGLYGAQVVQLSGELLGQKNLDGNQVLELQSGQRIFRAELPAVKAGRLPQIPVGSRLQVTGVSLLERVEADLLLGGNGESPAASFGILLRNPWDVAVLERPPWWAWKHAALAIGTLSFVLAAAMLWIRYLRGKVARRTHQLNEAMNKLEKETRVSATLAERDRLAGEIHDSIEQGLSAIVIQIESALKHFERPDQARRHMDMAKSMATFSRTEVQNAVWDMQSPMLENIDLPGALQRVSQGISAGDRPRVTVNIEGMVQPLTSTVEHHLLRIAQEAITNAVKHGAPENIRIQLHYQADRVSLMIQDDGSGFVPGKVSTSGGHFGLQGMQLRAQKIDATLSVVSEVGSGTRVEVGVPCEKKQASQLPSD